MMVLEAEVSNCWEWLTSRPLQTNADPGLMVFGLTSHRAQDISSHAIAEANSISRNSQVSTQGRPFDTAQAAYSLWAALNSTHTRRNIIDDARSHLG